MKELEEIFESLVDFTRLILNDFWFLVEPATFHQLLTWFEYDLRNDFVLFSNIQKETRSSLTAM